MQEDTSKRDDPAPAGDLALFPQDHGNIVAVRDGALHVRQSGIELEDEV